MFDFGAFPEKLKSLFILPFFVKGAGKGKSCPQIFVSGFRG
jgi:hypothetical protein